MQNREIKVVMCACAMAACCVTLLANPASAATEKILYVFGGASRGAEPAGPLTADAAGNLYGTTNIGGTYGHGVVFKLTPASGAWRETVLYNFAGGFYNGAFPQNRLAIDSAGNIFGATVGGGNDWSNPAIHGWGVIYELSPSGTGYTETVLHLFAANQRTTAGILLDKSGNLYGETGGGEPSSEGTIYEMRPSSTGWAYRTIYNFAGGAGGNVPIGDLTFGADGNLYGTTANGGDGCPAGCGVIFQLVHGANNTWTEKVIYAFQDGADGGYPQEGPLVFDSAGNIYGAAGFGGDFSCESPNGCGVVYELSPSSSGSWTYTVLHTFTGSPNDGGDAAAGVTFDNTGNLWGTTAVGGADGFGTLYELTPASGGNWPETVVYSFTNGDDGGYPSVPLLLIGSNIYGTTGSGGANGQGVAYEFPGAAK
jgi:uncharacterized repeat protein (TIGR03803 family)